VPGMMPQSGAAFLERRNFTSPPVLPRLAALPVLSPAGSGTSEAHWGSVVRPATLGWHYSHPHLMPQLLLLSAARCALIAAEASSSRPNSACHSRGSPGIRDQQEVLCTAVVCAATPAASAADCRGSEYRPSTHPSLLHHLHLHCPQLWQVHPLLSLAASLSLLFVSPLCACGRVPKPVGQPAAGTDAAAAVQQQRLDPKQSAAPCRSPKPWQSSDQVKDLLLQLAGMAWRTVSRRGAAAASGSCPH